MKMKKVLALGLTLALAGGVMTACSQTEEKAGTNASTDTAATAAAPEVKEISMNYMTPAEVMAQLNSDEYLIMDVRKAADFNEAHIPGVVGADMDAAKEGDTDTGLKEMEAALTAATGSKDAAGKKLVFVCYSGKRYAQAATNVAGALGVDPANMFTLEGGMEAWNAEYAEGTIPGEIKVDGDTEMKYMSIDDAKANLDKDDYVFVDLRKAEDNKAAHIDGTIAADLDAAKEGDMQAGAETLGRELLAATGSVTGADKNLVMVCYSGKRYAQAGTNVLNALGANMDKVVTLEGGMKAWEEAGEPTVQ